MPASNRTVRVTIQLSTVDYRAFTSAARQLRRAIGSSAPSALTLIQFNLQNRDAIGLTDDYLDAVRWPTNQLRGRKTGANDDSSAFNRS